jgi:tRNA nucleotidyltransferase (CCA-adding enzyme)
MLTGKHLLDLGFKPGKEMGSVLKAAFELQLNGDLTSVEQAVEWAKGQR